MAPNLFALARGLWEQRPQSPEFVLGSSPGKDCFCSSATKHNRTAKINDGPFSFRARKIDKKMFTFLEFPHSNTAGIELVLI
jgi:hypothetical protein